ncbi:MAG: site-specific integrase [Planctomycetes bacterium]|nr:site-specific integrase [Planctomycetota bacterium]
MSLYRPTYRVKGEGFRSPTWWIQFRDHKDVRRKIRGLADRRSTEAMEEKLKHLVHARASATPPSSDIRRWCDALPVRTRETLARFDLLDRKQLAAAAPLAVHIDAWQEHLAAKGTGRPQKMRTRSNTQRVIEACGFRTFADIDPTRVERYLRDRRERGVGKRAPMSARTSNGYLQAIREFLGWAIRSGLIAEDPLRGLRPLNAELDRRRERRALTADELRALLAATESAPPYRAVTGHKRAVLYRVAAETGLRLGELRALVVADVDLTDIDRASIRVRATNAKNRREARLPLRAGTAAAVRDYIGKALPMARVFELYRWWPAATVIRDYLALAGIAYRDDAGRVVDFHSLRVTFATNLARSRVPLQLAQRLMRHSDPRLTSSIYTVLNSDDEREAVAALPDLDVAPPALDAALATGTDDAAPASSDARVDALFAAWSDLDERARDALLQRAKTLGRG